MRISVLTSAVDINDGAIIGPLYSRNTFLAQIFHNVLRTISKLYVKLFFCREYFTHNFVHINYYSRIYIIDPRYGVIVQRI